MLRLAAEGLDLIDSRLRIILYALAEHCWRKYAKPLVVTSLIREKSRGVHRYGRGADLRTYEFTPKQCDEIVEWGNKHFIYDHNRPQFKTVVDEREPISAEWTGAHLHVQVNPSNETVIKA